MSTTALREQVTRHRGGGRDENGQMIPESNEPLTSIGVAPGGGVDRLDRGRTGEDIAYTVYFAPGTDIVNSDELTVRGNRFPIIVNDWRATTGLGGLEVQCKRGQG